jgi:hypothetical protein
LHPVDVVIASDMTHQRKLVDDPTTAVDDRGELVYGLQIVVRVCPCDGPRPAVQRSPAFGGTNRALERGGTFSP